MEKTRTENVVSLPPLVPLKVTGEFEGAQRTVWPVVLRSGEGEDTVLVDCGYKGFLPHIEKAMEKAGVQPAAVTHIFLTHQDQDHMGAAAAWKEKYRQVKVVASAEQAPYIEGKKPFLRLSRIEARLAGRGLSREERSELVAFQKRIQAVETVAVDEALAGGQLLPWGGGCQVIDSSGHQPGHLSLYLPHLSAVVTGDAAFLGDNGSIGVNPAFALNLPEAQKAFEMLMALPATHYYCYHGGLWKKA